MTSRTHEPRTRTIREVLSERIASGLAEGLGGVAIAGLVIAMLSTGAVSTISAVTTIASKSERQALISTLVGHENAFDAWGTKPSPRTTSVDLPDGQTVPVTTWREVDPTSTRLTAVTPTISGSDAADCSTPSDVAKDGCIYATRVHARGMDELAPSAIARKVAGQAGVIGAVDESVGVSALNPPTALTTFAPDRAGVIRYLVSASSDYPAEIRFSQGSRTLARIDVTRDSGNYFGTFTVAAGAEVVATVEVGTITVNSIFIYRAGDSE